MSERPIMFSGPMVRAILGGRKTQTRRLMRPQPEPIPEDHRARYKIPYTHWWASSKAKSMVAVDDLGGGFCCPYGSRGDRLWVKEAFAWSVRDPESHADDEDNHDPVFRATAEGAGEWERYEDGKIVGRTEPTWRSPLFMPRWASRITLEVTAVRVERVQAITEADAMAEGVVTGDIPADDYCPRRIGYVLGQDDGRCLLYPSAKEAFAIGWDSINGKRHLPMLDDEGVSTGERLPVTWASNPWVWVIEFRRAS